MGCQKSLATQIRDLKADYLFGLKGNQSGLLNQAEILFNDGLTKYPEDFDSFYASPVEIQAGRVEYRDIALIKLNSEDVNE
jgi:predicted transposase YbfD/YdcC